MGAGGWNKGIKNSTGNHEGKRHSEETKLKLRNRPSEIYKKPKVEHIVTTDLCAYGCGEIAKFKFGNGKLCCSKHYNSCANKRDKFSKLDHSERTAKSLNTRASTGITKTSQIKGAATRKANGFYEKLGKKMQLAWATNPWNNNLHCPLLQFKETQLTYQGSYELSFLTDLENKHGIEWLVNNVTRGPSIWYTDPSGKERLYISDFIIGNTIYEIKSGWTWNQLTTGSLLEQLNNAKLTKCVELGYNVILILDGEEIIYGH